MATHPTSKHPPPELLPSSPPSPSPTTCSAATIQLGFAGQMPPQAYAGYLQKRAVWYQQRLCLSDYHGEKDDFDTTSHTLLATLAGECVGGLRATIRHPGASFLLPMEVACPGLQLAAIYPELGLHAVPHAELSKLIVHSASGSLLAGNGILSGLLTHLLVTHNPEPDVPFAFLLAPRLQMRLYTAEAAAMGLKHELRPVPAEFLPPVLLSRRPVQILLTHLPNKL